MRKKYKIYLTNSDKKWINSFFKIHKKGFTKKQNLTLDKWIVKKHPECLGTTIYE